MAFETNKARVTWVAYYETFTGRKWVAIQEKHGDEGEVKAWAVAHASDLTDFRVTLHRMETWTLPE